MKQYSFEKTIERKFDSDPDLALLCSRERIESLKAEAKMNKRKQIIESYLKHEIYQTNGYWCTYIDDKTSSRGRKRIKNKTKEGLEEKLLDLHEKENAEEAKPVTFGEVYMAWRRVHDKTICGNSVRRYETDFQRFFERSEIMDTPIIFITKSDVEAFIAGQVYCLKLSKSACKKLYEYTKDTFGYAIEKELIDRDPMYSIKCSSFFSKCTNSKRSKKVQVFDTEEINRIYEQIRKDHEEKPNYIPCYAIELAMLTGLRVGEISALRWEDIGKDTISISSSEKYDRKKRIFYIDDTKNGVNRTIPVTDDIRDFLDDLKKIEMKYGYLSEYVFSNENGRSNAPTISSCIRNKCKQAGVEQKGIHNIRKTVNSYLKKNGASSKEASLLMGHTEETNSKYYTYDVFSMDEKKKLMAAGSIVSKRKTASN